jgi:putative ABC transport system permease protein
MRSAIHAELARYSGVGPAVTLRGKGCFSATRLPELRTSMNKLIFANLLRRPLRSIISILAVAIEVIMILSIVGIFLGILNDSRNRTNGIGADLMMEPSNGSIMNGISGAPIPVNFAVPIRKLPHVTVVAPTITHLNTSADNFGLIYGIDFDSFNALRPFTFVSGGAFKGPNDVIVDDVFAAGRNPVTGQPYKLGDTIKVMDHSFRICGIVEAGKGGRKMLPITTMGDLMGSVGRASIFYIKSDDPANDQAIIREIHATPGLEDYPVQTMEEWLSEMTPERIPAFNLALGIVTGIAVIVGFLVIFQSMYTAVLERTREIGILKSLGSSKPMIVSVVLRETAILAFAGVLVGVAGTWGVRLLLAHVFPTTNFQMTGLWILYGALIAFAGALCGALYPAWMAARKDPIDALAYE